MANIQRKLKDIEKGRTSTDDSPKPIRNGDLPTADDARRISEYLKKRKLTIGFKRSNSALFNGK